MAHIIPTNERRDDDVTYKKDQQLLTATGADVV